MTTTKRPKQKAKTEVDPKLDAPIDAADRTHASDEERLDTGMKVGEAIARAAAWWERKGRRLMKSRNFDKENRAFKFFNPNPGTIAEASNWLPSGIMAGELWEDLTRQEKLQITKLWHHHHVRVPNIGLPDKVM